MSDFSDLIPFFKSISNNFPHPNFFLEQYISSIDILRYYFEVMPSANHMTILDLGVGTGILSFLAIKKGAFNVIGIDIDSNALKMAYRTAKKLNVTNFNLIHSSVEFFNFSKLKNNVTGVIMNPPFGTKRKFLDFVFLKKAMETNGWILTLHKNNLDSDRKLRELCKTNNYIVNFSQKLIYSLPKSHKQHTLEHYNVEVILYYLEPNIKS